MRVIFYIIRGKVERGRWKWEGGSGKGVV